MSEENKEPDWWKKLPEHQRLIAALKMLRDFQSIYEKEVLCTGCKCCLLPDDFDELYMNDDAFKLSERQLRKCSPKKVIKENLSNDLQKEYEDMFDEIGAANVAHLDVIGFNYKK